jgi:hypothetical protein
MRGWQFTMGIGVVRCATRRERKEAVVVTDGPVAKVREELRAPRAAGVAGLVFAVFFAGSLLFTMPPRDRSLASLNEWYLGGAQSKLLLVGLYGIPLAGIAFLWFIGVVRDRIGDREDRFFSTVFLGSGLLFVAMLFAAAAAGTALVVRADALGTREPLSLSALQMTASLWYSFMYVYAARAAGVFMIVTSTITLRTGVAPRWVAIVGFVVAAALLLSLSFFQVVIMLFPAWVALVSLFILLTPDTPRLDDR